MLLRRFIEHVKDQNWFAVGLDVIVVIVGIFLGMQVTDWNEHRKDNAIELKTLAEIKKNLEGDLDEIRNDIGHMYEMESQGKMIIEYLKTNETPNEEFFGWASRLRLIPHFDENRSGYDLLKNHGVDLIKNDEIREALSGLYERYYSYYAVYERERMDFHRVNSMPRLIEYFYMPLDYSNGNWLEYDFVITNEDYQKLRSDTQFVKLIHAIIYENSAIVNRASLMEEMILKLITMIDEELKSRQ